MEWSEFYYVYSDWSESTLRSRISSLIDMGSGDEVVDVVLDLPTEKLKAQLIRKAMRLKVSFSHDDFMNLEGELPEELYQEVATYAGFDASCPDLDPNNLAWDDFYFYCGEWSETDILRRINQLKVLGPADEVCDAICNMPNWDCQEALYQKAVQNGVKFNHEQLEDMGRYNEDTDTEEYVPIDDVSFQERVIELEEDVAIICSHLDEMYPPKPKKKGFGFWGGLALVLSALFGSGSEKKDSGRCDGDCANCPPHYGYRYGRWYYGHGHRYGCTRGGNGGV